MTRRATRRRAFLLCCLFASIAGLAGCHTTIAARHVTPPPPPNATLPNEGIYYFLPKTLVRVSVSVKDEEEKKGDFSDFAPYFFPGLKTISADQSTYSIDPKAVVVSTRGVKDPSQMYRINPSFGVFTDTNFHFVMNDQAVPSQITATVENHAVDFAFTVGESTASLFAKAVAGAASVAGKVPFANTASTGKLKPVPCSHEDEFDGAQKAHYQELSDVLKSLYCNIDPVYRVQVFTEHDDYALILRDYLNKNGLLTGLSDNRRAGQSDPTPIARFLAARAAYLSFRKLFGEDGSMVPENISDVSDASLKLALLTRQAQAEKLLALFVGSRKTNPAYWTGTYEIDPEAPPARLFAYDISAGVCTVDTTQLVSEVRSGPLAACPASAQVVSIAFTPNGPPTSIVASNSSRESGLRYRIPRETLMALNNGATELTRQKIMVAQFGNVAMLPARTSGSKAQIDVKLDAATGALLDVTMGKNSLLNGDLVKRAAAVADTAIATKQKIDEQNKPATDLENAEAARKLKQEQLRTKLLDACLNDPSLAGCADLISE